MNRSTQNKTDLELRVIGTIKSSIKSLAQAPKQGTEGGINAWIDLEPFVKDAMFRLKTGEKYVILTWLHKADRSCMQVHPRGNPDNPLTGVFGTRSPNRPNPIGLHEVTLLGVQNNPPRLHVTSLEAIDGTPVLDIKPCLHEPQIK
ncbi:conserved hypothetical protein [Desulfamplus magnetovallimortis]|uniref:TsaA-like domain-containing protein n=1 Tax=Desulfamplus magnetovallimortis TaxID=1246637 RepID=A0A1W1H8N0_9BACT|nr:tRNA (N6-threonylcarbamoyladenosine(37)-N6)-methyltransferase TrmO [Desulfamplus magnetovallimortis]SLM28822.1 conserved hypothetical protein [Desulfamplus magnetovallimortis]